MRDVKQHFPDESKYREIEYICRTVEGDGEEVKNLKLLQDFIE